MFRTFVTSSVSNYIYYLHTLHHNIYYTQQRTFIIQVFSFPPLYFHFFNFLVYTPLRVTVRQDRRYTRRVVTQLRIILQLMSCKCHLIRDPLFVQLNSDGFKSASYLAEGEAEQFLEWLC